MKRFENKVVAVTGAGQGLGLAIAKAFAEEGAIVYMIGRTASKLENAAKEAGLENMIPYTMDVGEEAAWQEFVAFIKEKHGEMDVLVNNAAVLLQKNILAISYAEFKEMFRCNLDSQFLGMKYCHDILKKGGDGSIVNISSMGSVRVGELGGHDCGYHASKAAVTHLTRHAAYEFASEGIRVNAVLPGSINSPMLTAYLESNPAVAAGMAQIAPLPPYMVEPATLAQSVLFLADPVASASTTGATLGVDNGATL